MKKFTLIILTILTASILTISAFGQNVDLQGSNNPKSPKLVSSDGFSGKANVYPTKPRKVEYFAFKAGENLTYSFDFTVLSSTSANSLTIEFLDETKDVLTTVNETTLLRTNRESKTEQVKFYSAKSQTILLRVTFVLLDRDGNPREHAQSEEQHDIDEETATVSSIDYVATQITYRLKITHNGLFRTTPVQNAIPESGFKTKKIGGVIIQ